KKLKLLLLRDKKRLRKPCVSGAFFFALRAERILAAKPGLNGPRPSGRHLWRDQIAPPKDPHMDGGRASSPRRSIAHQAQHFLAAALVIEKAAEKTAGDHADAGRANAAAGHAAVLRFDHDGNALRMKIFPDALRDLSGQPLLHLQPPCKAIEDAC